VNTVLICPSRLLHIRGGSRLGHAPVQTGVYIPRVRNNDVSIPAINIRTTATQLRRDGVPGTVVVVVVVVVGEYCEYW